MSQSWVYRPLLAVRMIGDPQDRRSVGSQLLIMKLRGVNLARQCADLEGKGRIVVLLD